MCKASLFRRLLEIRKLLRVIPFFGNHFPTKQRTRACPTLPSHDGLPAPLFVLASHHLQSTMVNPSVVQRQTPLLRGYGQDLLLVHQASIILKAVFCVSVRVCVSVISYFSGTGCRSTMPLSPTWKASPGELHQLLLELTRRVVREEKPLELFHW